MSEIEAANRHAREEILRRVASSEALGMVILADAEAGSFACTLGDTFSEKELLAILAALRSGYANLEQRLFGTIVDALAHRLGPAVSRSEIEQKVNEIANDGAAFLNTRSLTMSRLSVERPEGGGA